ncbi:hypothetical protein ACH42_07875 [Endozoicomonas sp. (ex Bugula neritina AB1)]|nr:hypothetical protein ACH42_07875 [Endozoicomonas sp. (ex Bugula neritina AB1)]
MPVSQAPLPNWNDKIQHILAFATITLLIDAAWPTMPLNYQKILAIISYGFLIEILQSFTEDRSASFADIVADAGGIFLYWLSIPFLQKLPVLKIRWHFSQDRLC